MRLATVACTLGVILAACSPAKKIIPGEGPVVQFARQDHWLYVYASSDARLDELFNVEALSPFEPGFSPGDAVTRFGAPQTNIPEEMGQEYVQYVTAAGRFRLGREESAAGNVSKPLYFYPNDRRPEALFPTAIVGRLRPEIEKEVVMLFKCGFSQPFIHAVINNGQVDEVVWLPDDEIGRRDKSTQCTD
jgi:hypothetical protein